MNPTKRLLLGLAHGELTAAERAEVEALLQEAVDWAELAELAALHGVISLVRRNLLALSAQQQAPDEAWRFIQQAAAQVAFDGMLRLRQAGQVLATLQAAAIEPLLLKGFALADLLYSDPVLRPSADIDLLIRFDEIEGAVAALETIGCRPPSKERIEFQLAYSYDLALVVPAGPVGNPVELELHWDLAPRGLFSLDLDNWRSRSQPFPLNAGEKQLAISRFSPEDMLLHLALHMRKHRYVGLRWLADVAELLRRFQGRLDWIYVSDTARRAGLVTLLYTTLSLAGRYLAAPLPPDLLAELRPSVLRRRLLSPVLSQDALLAPVEMEDAGWTRLAPAELLLLDRPGAMGRELRFQLFKPSAAYKTPEAQTSSRLALNARRLARRTATLLRR